MPGDLEYMREALKLAESARGRTSPDPMVGAVIVKDGEIIATGYHAEQGTPHAEAWAIEKAGEKAKGATLYLNLEPCSHFGYNPPCADKIIKAGIKKVVAAMQDPNPLVSGKGFKDLREAGIEVEEGLLEDEAKRLNEVFIKWISTGRPFVILKTAMTLDGKIATAGEESRWITGPESRQYGHKLRAEVDAILVGIGTVLKDDPELNVRDIPPPYKNPLKIVLDEKAQIPLNARILQREPEKTIIIVTEQASKEKAEQIKQTGAEVILAKAEGGLVDLKKLMELLGKRNITSLLIEGGARVNASALQEDIVDKVCFFIAPKIVGGEKALTPVEGEGIKKLSDSIKIKDIKVQQLGDDVLLEGYIAK